MKLAELTITRGWRSKDPLSGTIKFKGDAGDVTLNLDEEFSQKVVALFADQMITEAKTLADNLTASIIEGTPATLIAPPETPYPGYVPEGDDDAKDDQPF